MKIKRKDKEEGSEKRDLTKKVGIASSSVVGSGIGALSGYGLSRIGEEKRKKKIADEQYRIKENFLRKQFKGLSDEELGKVIENYKPRLKMEAKKEADKVKTTVGRKLGFIVPGAIIGATAGGIAYDKITKKKRRSRDNENNPTIRKREGVEIMKIIRQKEYSKFGHALKHIGRGAAIGAGIGGMIGSHNGAKKGSTSYKPALIGAGIGAIIGGTLGVLGHKVDWSISHEAEEYERTHKAEVKEALNSIQIDEIIKRLEGFNNTEIYKRLNYINFLRFELEGTEYSEYIDEFGDICSTLIGGYPSVFTIKPKEIKEQVAISLSKNKTYLPLLACAFRDYEGVIIDDNTLVYDWKKKSFGIMNTDWKLVGSLGSFDSAKTRCIKYLKDSKTTPKNVIDKDMYDELIESMDGFYIHDELDFPSYEEVCKVMSGIINKAIDEYIKEINKI